MPADGDQSGTAHAGQGRLDVVGRPVSLEAPVVGLVPVAPVLYSRGRPLPVVLVRIQRSDLGPARLEIGIIADVTGPVALEVVPVDVHARLLARVLEHHLQVRAVWAGVAQ